MDTDRWWSGGWVDGLTDRWMDGWMDAWMDGWSELIVGEKSIQADSQTVRQAYRQTTRPPVPKRTPQVRANGQHRTADWLDDLALQLGLSSA